MPSDQSETDIDLDQLDMNDTVEIDGTTYRVVIDHFRGEKLLVNDEIEPEYDE